MGGEPEKGKHTKQCLGPRPKLGWLRPIGAVANSPSPAQWGVRNISGRAAAPSRAPLRPHSPDAQVRDCTGAAASRCDEYGTCAPRALAAAMLGPHHGAPSPRARCQGGLPRNPQRRPSLTTDEGATYRLPEVDCALFADLQVAPVLGILARSPAAAPSN